MAKIRLTALMLSMTLTASLWGCSGKKDSSSDTAPETTAASASTNDTNSTTSVTTTAASVTTTETTTVTTAPPVPEPPKSGYPTSIEAAKAYYREYLDHDAEAVYVLFNKDEIEAYKKLMEPEFSGQSIDEVFRKAVLVRAIESSMDNICSIMEEYNSGGDKWTVKLEERDLQQVSEAILKNYNENLGLSYSQAEECRFVLYLNETNRQSFTGNGSSYVEIDGKWYLSFADAMRTDLLNYFELE